MVAATCGSTVLASYDPLEPIADICERHGDIWLHVDAAWGGGALMTRKYRHLIKGVHRVKSLTWCLHKMMGVPFQCTSFVVNGNVRTFLLLKHSFWLIKIRINKMRPTPSVGIHVYNYLSDPPSLSLFLSLSLFPSLPATYTHVFTPSLLPSQFLFTKSTLSIKGEVFIQPFYDRYWSFIMICAPSLKPTALVPLERAKGNRYCLEPASIIL